MEEVDVSAARDLGEPRAALPHRVAEGGRQLDLLWSDLLLTTHRTPDLFSYSMGPQYGRLMLFEMLEAELDISLEQGAEQDGFSV